MASSGKEAAFRISIDGNAADATRDVSASARLAAQAITKYEEEIKTLSGDLRRLKGNSDEVNAAKKDLKEKVDKARSSVALLTLELNRQGTTFAAASKSSKKWSDGLAIGVQKAKAKLGMGWDASAPLRASLGKSTAPVAKKLAGVFGPAAKKVGATLAPAGRAIGKLGSGGARAIGKLGSVARPLAEKTLPALSRGLSLAATGASVAAAAVAAAGVAAGAAGVAVIGFGLSSADSAAKMQRQREAILGSAKDAEAFGTQITALAGKVPQGVEELNELARSVSKTRLTGKAMVDTFKAVAQATGAVDAEAGAKIQDLITRNQASGRMAIGRLELQGTGLDFDDVAKEYAAGTKKSIDAARKELQSGVAPIEDGAEALRKATEKKFGALNLKNAFSLENAPKKFVEQFRSLSSGIKLEPLTKGLQEAFGQLAPEAPLGRAVQTLMTTLGNGFADVAGKSIPLLVEGFKWLIVGGLRVTAFFLDMRNRMQDAFSTEGWAGLGKQVVLGLIEGWDGMGKWAADSIIGLAKSIKRAFTGELEIHSPSRIFAGYGKNTVEGYAQGVDVAKDRAAEAVTGMVPEAGGASSAAPRLGAAAAGGFSGTIEVHIHGAPVANTSAMQAPEFLAALSRAVRDALTSEGLVTA